MSRRPNVFIHKKCFIVLDNLIGGRITGDKQDTITVFYRGGDSCYFHIGREIEDVFEDLIRELQDMQVFESETSPTPNEKKWYQLGKKEGA